MTHASRRLRSLARRLAHVHLEQTGPAAILLVGSAAAGDADAHSDLDLILYYACPPADEALTAARALCGGSEPTPPLRRGENAVIETFDVAGVRCQLAHLAFADVEADIRRLVVELDPAPGPMKVAAGLHEGVPLHGADLIGRWRAAAAYTDELQRAVVERHWRIFPLWEVNDWIEARDALIWRQQILVEGALDLVAVLAAANRVWFSTFQFKRTRKLVASLRLAPPDLADRLESLLSLPPAGAAAELERLVAETRAIVASVRPELELPVRR